MGDGEKNDKDGDKLAGKMKRNLIESVNRGGGKDENVYEGQACKRNGGRRAKFILGNKWGDSEGKCKKRP